ncbi:hypothetical protein C8F04DRAFT_1235963 [Mycena alexandri]|uniref:Uncharacterized protein n=1 Tax=Mycena alexandri TaxID=1745969 RepID=A0AAD6WZZ8_9AGAR|nr:hypothetical protein C8F04DRAFT_1235963 [Mycena alexandri]
MGGGARRKMVVRVRSCGVQRIQVGRFKVQGSRFKSSSGLRCTDSEYEKYVEVERVEFQFERRPSGSAAIHPPRSTLFGVMEMEGEVERAESERRSSGIILASSIDVRSTVQPFKTSTLQVAAKLELQARLDVGSASYARWSERACTNRERWLVGGTKWNSKLASWWWWWWLAKAGRQAVRNVACWAAMSAERILEKLEGGRRTGSVVLHMQRTSDPSWCKLQAAHYIRKEVRIRCRAPKAKSGQNARKWQSARHDDGIKFLKFEGGNRHQLAEEASQGCVDEAAAGRGICAAWGRITLTCGRADECGRRTKERKERMGHWIDGMDDAIRGNTNSSIVWGVGQVRGTARAKGGWQDGFWKVQQRRVEGRS